MRPRDLSQLEALRDFATDREKEYIEAIGLYGSARVAEKSLGLGNDTINKAMRRLEQRAAARGFAPEHHFTRAVPEGFIARGVSTYYDSDGKPRGQWVKAAIDQQSLLETVQSVLEEAAARILEQSKGCLPPVTAPAACDADLLTVIPMGDPHFGLLTWAAEVGENFDLKIAEQLTCDAIDRLAMSGPPSETALLLNLGDFFHADNSTNRTPRSGAALDVDGRFDKIAAIGVSAMVRCVRRLLEKHQKVIVRNNRGNHDPHQAAMLTLALQGWFHSEPRVHIETTPSSFYYHRFGKVLIGSTHGDGAKLTDLPLIMATDVPAEWAAAEYRVWHCGHFHHDQLKDHPGVTVETHRTLAANDAWHRHSGYRSARDMKAIVYHRELGEVTRIRCGIGALKEAA